MLRVFFPPSRAFFSRISSPDLLKAFHMPLIPRIAYLTIVWLHMIPSSYSQQGL